MRLQTKSLILYAFLGAILVVSQVALSFIPNVELVSFLIIIYSLIFKKRALYPVFIFNILMGMIYGFGPWIVGYFILWPILSLTTILLNKFLVDKYLNMAILSGLFGLLFGAAYAIPYLVVDPKYALTYWIAGIPYDLIHMVGNYFTMLLLGKTIYTLLLKLTKQYNF